MKLKIRAMSDLHNEMSLFDIPELPEDKQTVLILAGDLFTASMVEAWVDYFNAISKRFYHVLIVLGNHDYWKGTIDQTPKVRMRLIEERCDNNVHLLQNDYRIIDGVLFCGGTMWTDLADPMYPHNKHYMNDFRYIAKEAGGRLFNTGDWYHEHSKTVKFLGDCLKMFQEQTRASVVITHHAPHKKSIHSFYTGDAMNTFYVSDMEEFILSNRIDLWFHGHMHAAMDYMVGDTRVICNPRGYHRIADMYSSGYDEETGFNALKVIEI